MITAIAFAALLVAPAQPPPQRIALYDLESTTVDPTLARVVTDALAAELRKLEGLTVVGMDEIRAMMAMEAEKQLMGCSDDSCLAEIAEALGVDGIVIGNLAAVGDETIFGLKRIDQRAAKTVGQYTQRLTAATGEECLAVVGPAIEQLFPERGLLPGQTRGVAPELALRLNPPPLDPWVFYTGAAVTGGALLVGLGAAAVNAAAWGVAASSTDASVTGAAVDGGELAGTIGLVRGSFWGTVAAGAAMIVLGSATGVAALFTDWHGYRAMNE